ncbi:MAG: 16S rRNA (guanine(527)-N(7))-methyltransferase RsmG [Gammaproteobacteria bacterium]
MQVSETFARLTPDLESGLAALSLPTSLGTPALAYLSLLSHWNQAYNLTAIRTPAEMVRLHLLDSFSVHPYLHGDRVLDVGTGAGLPGIPLALANPERDFTLLDSLGKKTRFLQQAVNHLELENVTVVQSRIEDFQPSLGFSTVISRAFASLQDMVHHSRHCLARGGHLLAMKGQYPHAELAALGPEVEVLSVEQLEVPGLSAERHLVIMAAR